MKFIYFKFLKAAPTLVLVAEALAALKAVAMVAALVLEAEAAAALKADKPMVAMAALPLSVAHLLWRGVG